MRSPARMLISVVLPEPVNPTMETNWPSSTDRLIFFSTSRTVLPERYDFETSRTSRYAKSITPLQSQFEIAHHAIQEKANQSDRKNAEQNMRVDKTVVLLPEKASHARRPGEHLARNDYQPGDAETQPIAGEHVRKGRRYENFRKRL